ncbi:MAG: hypothetical protein KAS32_05185 [Candidatus Peribacteraceae bacterium]|nr:hypothetical protein [Candidatus Peribacteraceae bacterium]
MATYYIDFTNGNDGWVGNLANPWATESKAATTMVAGDKVIIRNGMTEAVAADLNFTNDGTLLQPITMESDFDNANWPVGGQDEVNSAQTYTPVFGAKCLLASGNPDFVVEEWMYESTEDNRLFAYEVAGVQNADNGTDDGADASKLDDNGKFANTVLGTQVVNTTDSITGYVSMLVDNNTVEVTLDGRPSADGGTVVVFDNGDTWTIADQIVLYLPYKGAISGAGKTLVRMPYAPKWNTAAGDFQVNLDTDYYWKFQRLHFRGTDANGVFEVDSVRYVEFHDMIIEGNGAGDSGIRAGGGLDGIAGVISKCRVFNYATGVHPGNFSGGKFRDNLLDGNNVAASAGIKVEWGGIWLLEDSEFRRHAGGDVSASPTTARNPTYPKLRNCLLSSTVEYDIWDDADAALSVGYSEDHDQNVGANEQSFALDSVAAGSIAIQKETTAVRAGGGTSSIMVTPMANMSENLEAGRLLLMEVAIPMASGVAKTYTVYLRSDDDTDWGADPTNTELYAELEYWKGAIFPHRIKLASTEVCNNFDNDDTVWDTLTVTATPDRTGLAYFRVYYSKTLEGGNLNIFYCDTQVEES